MRRPAHWYLQNIKLFASVPEADLRQLARESQTLQAGKRQRQLVNLRPDQTMLVVEGSAKLLRPGMLGRMVVETILERGDLLGSIAGQASVNRTQLEPLETLTTLTLPTEALRQLIARHSDFALTVIQQLEDRQRILRQSVDGLLFKDLTTRLIETLLWLAREHGDHCEHGWAVDLRVNQQDLADLVGATRQAVSAVLGKLERRMLLRRKGRVICIISLDRLNKMANIANNAD